MYQLVCELPGNVQEAIYEGVDDWDIKTETKLSGKIPLPDGTERWLDDAQTPISDEVYYIVPEKC
jgi:hypothetical protein